MAGLESKDSFKSLDSAFESHCNDLPEMSEKCESVVLVEERAVKPKKFNRFLRRTHSERNQSKQGKHKHGKAKTFSSIFLKKRVEEKINFEASSPESKSSQTNLSGASPLQIECSHMAEAQDLMEKNSELMKNVEEKEENLTELAKEKHDLMAKVKDLELELEESRLNNALARGTQREKEMLKKRVEAMNDDKETLEFHMAFLEEEKIEAEQRVNELVDDLRKWQEKYEKCETDRELYKNKFLHTKSHARQVISDYIGEVNELIQENRYLIKKGLRGRPKELEKIMRVTDEFLQLQAERNRLQESNEILSERIARQEVKIDDLKRELISAVIHLEQAGVDWRPMYEEDVDQKHDADQVRESQENEEPDEKFASPREDNLSDTEKIEIPLSVAAQRPVKRSPAKITVL